ncbi:hypothetical protein V7112_05315 [Bacillus sp. JJ1566]|uniref:hypothetical protein n=1 Tax=Bacillus sp. JJ1566 TaxID=3122961 RepID=UPI002FFFEAC4
MGLFNRKKHNIENMRYLAKERGGQCLSQQYVNINTKLQWMCSNGHIFESRPVDVLRGNWCPIDIGKKMNGGTKNDDEKTTFKTYRGKY